MSARPGANQPCPCGSNRKFKKCCGPRWDASHPSTVQTGQRREPSTYLPEEDPSRQFPATRRPKFRLLLNELRTRGEHVLQIFSPDDVATDQAEYDEVLRTAAARGIAIKLVDAPSPEAIGVAQQIVDTIAGASGLVQIGSANGIHHQCLYHWDDAHQPAIYYWTSLGSLEHAVYQASAEAVWPRSDAGHKADCTIYSQSWVLYRLVAAVASRYDGEIAPLLRGSAAGLTFDPTSYLNFAIADMLARMPAGSVLAVIALAKSMLDRWQPDAWSWFLGRGFDDERWAAADHVRFGAQCTDILNKLPLEKPDDAAICAWTDRMRERASDAEVDWFNRGYADDPSALAIDFSTAGKHIFAGLMEIDTEQEEQQRAARSNITRQETELAALIARRDALSRELAAAAAAIKHRQGLLDEQAVVFNEIVTLADARRVTALTRLMQQHAQQILTALGPNGDAATTPLLDIPVTVAVETRHRSLRLWLVFPGHETRRTIDAAPRLTAALAWKFSQIVSSNPLRARDVALHVDNRNCIGLVFDLDWGAEGHSQDDLNRWLGILKDRLQRGSGRIPASVASADIVILPHQVSPAVVRRVISETCSLQFPEGVHLNRRTDYPLAEVAAATGLTPLALQTMAGFLGGEPLPDLVPHAEIEWLARRFGQVVAFTNAPEETQDNLAVEDDARSRLTRNIRPWDAVAAFESHGWEVNRRRGSHVTMKKPGVAAVLTIPVGGRNVPPGLLRGLISLAGLQPGDFADLLEAA